jgi:orotate phosphoribosyltransferase
MNEQEVIRCFESVGAIMRGHFVGTSGKHLDKYVTKDAVSIHPPKLSRLAAAIAATIRGEEIEVVLAPAVGCIPLGQWVAHYLFLETNREVLSLYAERMDGQLVLRRGFGIHIRGKRTLVLDDIVNTGKSLCETVDCARKAKAEVIAAAALWSRGGASLEALGNPPTFNALANVRFPAWTPEECRQCGPCSLRIPVSEEFGHYELYLEQQKQLTLGAA